MLRTDDDDPDVAAEAFARVERELAALRSAIERQSPLDLPDYSETLGRMQQALDALAERLAAAHELLGRRPALDVTPETMTQRILSAGSVARREDQAMLTAARKGLDDATRDLQRIVASSRLRGEQRRWLIRAGLAGMVSGMILWAIGAGIVARAMPAGWLWPERMAARSLRVPMWEGGQRLMQAAGSEAHADLVTADCLTTTDRGALTACRKRQPPSPSER